MKKQNRAPILALVLTLSLAVVFGLQYAVTHLQNDSDQSSLMASVINSSPGTRSASTQVIIGSTQPTNLSQKTPNAITISSSIKSAAPAPNSGNDLSTALSSDTAVAPVIITLRVPYSSYYERGQSVNTTKTKKAQFNAAQATLANNRFKNKARSKIKKSLTIVNSVSADIDRATFTELLNDPNVKSIKYDMPVRAFLDTSVTQISAPNVWANTDSKGLALTGFGQTIAVIDTGVDYTHRDLGGCLGPNCKVIGGFDFVNNDGDPMDDQGHGTHVAATAAGKGLLNGVAPDAKILAYKVLDASGAGLASAIIGAIERATDPNSDGNTSDHADIISMSLGANCAIYNASCGPDDPLSIAVDQATAAGVVAIIAAGNSGPSASTVGSPGTSRTAITVAAACKTAQLGTESHCTSPIAQFSSRGPVIVNGIDYQKPDVSAPGVLICASKLGSFYASAPTCLDDSHMRISGTSMATPHVAGAAALIKQAYPNYTPEQIKTLIKNTANGLGGNMTYSDQGTGIVNLMSAVPFLNSGVTLTPPLWNMQSDPTRKISSHSQSFTIQPKTVTSGLLTVVTEFNNPGITISTNKSSYYASNAPESITVNISADNDIATPGNYIGRIKILDANNKVVGAAGILFSVKSTLKFTSSSPLKFGNDNPDLPAWTSSQQNIEVQNLRTDTTQTLSLKANGLPTSVTMNMPGSVSIQPGAKSIISANLTVNNSSLPNGKYNGSIIAKSLSETMSFPYEFQKNYAITVNAPDLKDIVYIIVRNAEGEAYISQNSQFSGTSHDIYVKSSGTYDVQVRYSDISSTDQSSTVRYMVIKEGISLSGGIGNVTVNRSDAKNLVTFNARDINGNPLSGVSGVFTYSYLPHPTTFPNIVLSEGWVGETTKAYFSDFSKNYQVTLDYRKPFLDPTISRYYFKKSFTGLGGPLTLYPDPITDFVTEIYSDKSSASTQPLVFYNGGQSLDTGTILSLNFPFKQHLYFSPLTSDSIQVMSDRRTNCPTSGACPAIYTTPQFNSLGKRWYGNALGGYKELPPGDTNIIYDGLGPSLWVVKLRNTPSQITFESALGYTTPTIFSPVLVRQDFALLEYNLIPYKLYRNSTLINSGNFPPWEQTLGSLSVSPGAYEIQSAFVYPIQGTNFSGNVSLAFDTTKADPNPPALNQLYIYSKGLRSEYYRSGQDNKIIFGLEAVGGTLSSVSASYSTDGSTFTPVTVTPTSPTYQLSLPNNLVGSIITIRITANDDSSNKLTYTFTLPSTNTAVTAQFPMTVTVTEAGAVRSANGEISCPPYCNTSFNDKSIVTLQAQPGGSNTGVKWTGCDSSTALTCTVNINSVETVAATFNVIPIEKFQLSVGLTGLGGSVSEMTGVIISNPAGIFCPTICKADFNSGTQVQLSVNAASNLKAQSWNGCEGIDSGYNCFVTLRGPRTINTSVILAPTVAPLPTDPKYKLTVNPTGNGIGYVVSQPSGVACPLNQIVLNPNCSTSYAAGTIIYLTATPGDSNVTWNGCDRVVYTNSVPYTCVVTLSADKTITSNFTAVVLPSTPTGLTANASGGGSVSLGWNVSTSGTAPIQYDIYRSTSPTGVSGRELPIKSQAGTNYTDTGLTPGVTYYYQVAAGNYMSNNYQSSNRSSPIPVTVQ